MRISPERIEIYREAENGFINYNSSHVQQKDLVNLGASTNQQVYAANVYPPKINTARAVLANAIAFGPRPRDVATSGISTP